MRLLDPEDPGGLEALELDAAGRYATVAAAVSDETVERRRPFPVTVSPALLLSK